jgi:hypothetical protein
MSPGKITVEDVPGYSVRVLRVLEDGLAFCTISEPSLDALAIPGSVPGDLVNPVAEAVFMFLIAEEQARILEGCPEGERD